MAVSLIWWVLIYVLLDMSTGWVGRRIRLISDVWDDQLICVAGVLTSLDKVDVRSACIYIKVVKC